MHMQKSLLGAVVVAVFFPILGPEPVRAADDYAVDAMHSGVNFKISHLGLSWVYGRFNEFTGTFTLDAEDPAKSSFSLDIKSESIDTNNKKRDEHLRSPDFFNVKQFPALTFKSTAVKAAKDGYEVTGDLTLHGVTKPVTFTVVGGRKAEFPKGVQRTGFSTDLTIKRVDFGMDKGVEAIGNEVYLSISFEGTKK
jgi:polyisoprenoid-binding protein YceI